MALSLGVLLVLVLLVVVGFRTLQGGDQPVVIDPAPAVADARRLADFPVSEPAGLDEGWRPLSARFVRASGADGSTLRIGYLTPSDAGVQFVQSDTEPVELLATELGDRPRAEGTESVAGRDWQRYAARRGEVALVLSQPEHTVIVIGAAPLDEVRELAAATVR